MRLRGNRRDNQNPNCILSCVEVRGRQRFGSEVASALAGVRLLGLRGRRFLNRCDERRRSRSGRGCGGARCRSLRRAGAVDLAIDVGVAHDDLDVVARFGEWNRLDQFGDFFVVAFGAPRGDAIFTGVECRERVLGFAGRLQQAGDVKHSEFEIVFGVEELRFGVANLELFREQLAGLRQNLHQADGVGVRNDVGLEGRFLANQTGGEHRIEIVALGFAAKRGFVGQRVRSSSKHSAERRRFCASRNSERSGGRRTCRWRNVLDRTRTARLRRAFEGNRWRRSRPSVPVPPKRRTR